MKEILYVGYYVDTNKDFILKIGTTNDPDRRKKEHERNYRKAQAHTMPVDENFHYLLCLPLSKYNTLRYEDDNKRQWRQQQIGEYIRNDRFKLGKNPPNIKLKIRKEYEIELPQDIGKLY